MSPALRRILIFSAGSAFGIALSLAFHTPAPNSAAEPKTLRPTTTDGPLASRRAAQQKPSASSLEEILAAARPGEVNSALIRQFQEALADPSSARRSRRWNHLLEAMRPEDALAVRQLFLDADAQGRMLNNEWQAFWPRWGEIDAKAALKYLTDLSAIDSTISWLADSSERVMESWGSIDPAAAKAWLATKSPDEQLQWGLAGLVRGLAAQDLTAATQLASQYRDAPHLQSMMMESLANQAVQSRGTAGMVQWLADLPDDTARVAAFDHVVWRQFKSDPAAARDLIDRYPQLPWQNKRKVLPNLVEALAQTDPAAATKWATTQVPDTIGRSDFHSYGILQGMRRWVDTDATAAASWLAPQQGQPWYDVAASSMAIKLMDQGHPDATAWVDSIKDPEIQSQIRARLAAHPPSGQ
jgi:hypothetical protein